MTIISTTAAAVAHRVIAARTAYDAAGRAGALDFQAVTDELDNAVAAYGQYQCVDTADLAAFATPLWSAIDAIAADVAEFEENATAPLWEFFPIAAAVRLELTRLLSHR